MGWPRSFGDAEKADVAAGLRARTVREVSRLHDECGWGLADGKALLFHLTRPRGQCHRCSRLVEGAVSLCGFCDSLNLDW